MGKINENKLMNELVRDMNNSANLLEFLKILQSKYGMNEKEFKDSGLYPIWCKEKHEKPEYFPDEPDPINENTIRKAVRESLEEISWDTVMRAGEKSDLMANDLMDLGQAMYNYKLALEKFLKRANWNENSYRNIVKQLHIQETISALNVMLRFLKGKVIRRNNQSMNFKTSATDAEENYLNKNGVITNFSDIQV